MREEGRRNGQQTSGEAEKTTASEKGRVFFFLPPLSLQTVLGLFPVVSLTSRGICVIRKPPGPAEAQIFTSWTANLFQSRGGGHFYCSPL